MLTSIEIKTLCRLHGIKQGDFAELIGVPESSWSAYINGKAQIKPWMLEKATQVMKELGIYEEREERVNKLIVQGVGKDEPIVYNENGGGQSKVQYRFDLLDAKAMFAMTRVLDEGAQKYGADNWRLIDVKDHLNHLIIHTYAHLAGDTSDEHLSHALCRAMFALGVTLQEEDDNHVVG